MGVILSPLILISELLSEIGIEFTKTRPMRLFKNNNYLGCIDYDNTMIEVFYNTEDNKLVVLEIAQRLSEKTDMDIIIEMLIYPNLDPNYYCKTMHGSSHAFNLKWDSFLSSRYTMTIQCPICQTSRTEKGVTGGL